MEEKCYLMNKWAQMYFSRTSSLALFRHRKGKDAGSTKIHLNDLLQVTGQNNSDISKQLGLLIALLTEIKTCVIENEDSLFSIDFEYYEIFFKRKIYIKEGSKLHKRCLSDDLINKLNSKTNEQQTQ